MNLKAQKRDALLAILEVAVLGLANTGTSAQTPRLAQPGHRSPIHLRQVAVVRIKNGPILRGRLLQADKDSIRLEVADRGCPVTLDAAEVASIVYPMAVEVARQAPQKTPQKTPKRVRHW